MNNVQYQQVSPIKNIKGFTIYLLLLCAGIIGNYLTITLLPGVYFFFGSIATLVALYVFKARWAIGLGLIVTAVHYFFWNNPHAFLIFFAEVLFIAFARKKNYKLFSADAFFWILLGFPVGWISFFYILEMNYTLTIAVVFKVLVNGMLNALVASILITYLPLHKLAGVRNYDHSGKSLYQSIFTGLTAFILIPSLLLMFAQSSREVDIVEKNILEDLNSLAGLTISHTELWHNQHMYVLTSLANLASTPGISLEELQKATDNLKKGFTDLTRLHIDNSQGTSITFSPRTDADGSSYLGLNFSDRDYYAILKSTGQPYMSDVFMGRLGKKSPIVTMGAPVMKDRVFSGYVIGNVDLINMYKILEADSEFGSFPGYISILDSSGKVVVSTHSGIKMMDNFYSTMKGDKIQVNHSTYLWIPEAYKNKHEALQWDNAVYVIKKSFGSGYAWSVVVEMPFKVCMENMARSYAWYLGVLSVLVLFALFVASYITRKVASPVAELAAATSYLPQKMYHTQDGYWPESGFHELNTLVTNFKDMSEILRKNFSDLQNQFSFLDTLINTIPSPVFYKDVDGLFLGCNVAFENSMGLSREKIIGKSLYDLFTKEHAASFRAKDLELLENKRLQNYESVLTYADGSNHNVIFNKTVFYNSDGSLGGIVGIIIDITDLKQAEKLIWEEKERVQVTLHSIGDAVITTDALGNVTYLNPVAESLTGWNLAEAFDRPLLDVFKIINEQNGEPAENPVEKCLKEGIVVGLANHTQLISKEGKAIAIEDSAAPIKNKDDNIIGVVLVFHDVSEKRDMMQQMMYQAYHDPLTGLPNRILFYNRLELALAQAKRSDELIAVLFLDLDRFKVVNDMLGHVMGDQLLIEVAGRISNCIRSSDTIARLGGDEFTLLIPKLTQVNDATSVAQKILTCLQEPFLIRGNEFHISASIGISVFPHDGEDAETLMKHSDTAMYKSKEEGQNSYQLFSPDMNEQILEQVAIENSLRHALERNEFDVYYQPQVDAATGKIVGMEALLRWNHPERGLLLPGEFIPLAEETGLIVPIGEWVLKTACAQNKAWQQAGYKELRVTVNLSGYQFRQHDLLEKVAEVLRETELEPSCLELEITETVAMENVQFTIQTLEKLNQMGIRIAIDDFGTGYSSLSYLKSFPINTIKIDRSFITDITFDPGDAAIVATIIVMANNLNLKVIAEGVETSEQMTFLKENNCNEMQGYYYSKPVPVKAFEELIQKGGFSRNN